MNIVDNRLIANYHYYNAVRSRTAGVKTSA